MFVQVLVHVPMSHVLDNHAQRLFMGACPQQLDDVVVVQAGQNSHFVQERAAEKKWVIVKLVYKK